jgi:hypothetical protein
VVPAETLELNITAPPWCVAAWMVKCAGATVWRNRRKHAWPKRPRHRACANPEPCDHAQLEPLVALISYLPRDVKPPTLMSGLHRFLLLRWHLSPALLIIRQAATSSSPQQGSNNTPNAWDLAPKQVSPHRAFCSSVPGEAPNHFYVYITAIGRLQPLRHMSIPLPHFMRTSPCRVLSE